MRPDLSNSNSAPDDALSLFGHEARLASAAARVDASPASSEAQRADSGTGSAASLAHVSERAAAQIAPDPTGAVSLARLLDAAPMRFVEGVAVVQALCAVVRDKGGVHAGMPDLNGVFLTNSGEIVAVAPATGEPAARELGRLLHRLVPAESTPPVGRLFVDRWAVGTSTDLGEFSSELGYFARPNGRELLIGIHSRISPDQSTPVTTPLPLRDTRGVAARDVKLEKPKEVVEAVPPRERKIASWLHSHRRHITAAAAMVAITVAATGLVTWFSSSKPAEAAQPSEKATNQTENNQATPSEQTGTPNRASNGGSPSPKSTRTPAQRAARSAAPGPVRSSRVPESLRAQGAAAVPPTTAASLFNETPTAALPTRNLPDMRIYSAGDAGIEPPKLRSNELPEFLITGFPSRANSVEVIVDKSGGVERVRMLDGPQRIPDIMLLSRVKQWEFDPATKDGSAVRFRLILSWKVTP